ncbi:hypothetical protein PAPYR_3283 [Paratrimastix pyriformis]|uniref:Uncharacterized protein n=1 Tax=Paratrimastix pyriformis TaxID=342808 RepID=A0ABQ8USC7_9EUKA|nr:hypothetical protein PAPYR_3283 [Paratrimastix pyriformis]
MLGWGRGGGRTEIGRGIRSSGQIGNLTTRSQKLLQGNTAKRIARPECPLSSLAPASDIFEDEDEANGTEQADIAAQIKTRWSEYDRNRATRVQIEQELLESNQRAAIAQAGLPLEEEVVDEPAFPIDTLFKDAFTARDHLVQLFGIVLEYSAKKARETGDTAPLQAALASITRFKDGLESTLVTLQESGGDPERMMENLKEAFANGSQEAVGLLTFMGGVGAASPLSGAGAGVQGLLSQVLENQKRQQGGMPPFVRGQSQAPRSGAGGGSFPSASGRAVRRRQDSIRFSLSFFTLTGGKTAIATGAAGDGEAGCPGDIGDGGTETGAETGGAERSRADGQRDGAGGPEGIQDDKLPVGEAGEENSLAEPGASGVIGGPERTVEHDAANEDGRGGPDDGVTSPKTTRRPKSRRNRKASATRRSSARRSAQRESLARSGSRSSIEGPNQAICTCFSPFFPQALTRMRPLAEPRARGANGAMAWRFLLAGNKMVSLVLGSSQALLLPTRPSSRIPTHAHPHTRHRDRVGTAARPAGNLAQPWQR